MGSAAFLNPTELPLLMGGDIVLYEGSPLERIAASAVGLETVAKPLKKPQIYLASDVIVGAYGVTGFVLVDIKPERRWVSYTNSDWFGVTFETSGNHLLKFEVESDPVRRAHFFDTNEGFKMIRYFIMPDNVQEFFTRDKFLGEPMVDKCCRDGTLPEDYDEDPVSSNHAIYDESGDILEAVLKTINPSFGVPAFSTERMGHRIYFSFHSWQLYKPVLEVGEESVVRAIRNFDTFLSRFDQTKQLQRRELPLEAAVAYSRVLPTTPA